MKGKLNEKKNVAQNEWYFQASKLTLLALFFRIQIWFFIKLKTSVLSLSLCESFNLITIRHWIEFATETEPKLSLFDTSFLYISAKFSFLISSLTFSNVTQMVLFLAINVGIIIFLFSAQEMTPPAKFLQNENSLPI